MGDLSINVNSAYFLRHKIESDFPKGKDLDFFLQNCYDPVLKSGELRLQRNSFSKDVFLLLKLMDRYCFKDKRYTPFSYEDYLPEQAQPIYHRIINYLIMSN